VISGRIVGYRTSGLIRCGETGLHQYWRVRASSQRTFSIVTSLSRTVNASVAVSAASLLILMMQLRRANPVVTPFSRAIRFEVTGKQLRRKRETWDRTRDVQLGKLGVDWK
jgi:hypothetical protein